MTSFLPASVNPIKVLHLRSSPFLGSPERLILGRIKCLNRNECQYVIGIFDEQHDKENNFAHAVENLTCPVFLLRDSILWFPLNLVKLCKAVRSSRIHIICSHDYKSNMYGLIVGKLLKIPLMSVLHGKTWTDFKVRLYEMLDRLVLRYFQALICISKIVYAEQRNYREKDCLHTFLIPNAVDVEEIEKFSLVPDNQISSLKTNNERIVLFAGRLSREKGLSYLIEAAKNILSVRNDVKFIVLGEGPERKKLEKIIYDNKLDKWIHLLGFKKNIYPFYKAMDFLLLPSLTEGMPVVILEAFALGKPVIASRVGGVPDIVQHNANGLLVSPCNALELGNAIEYFLDHPEESRTMGENGRMLVKEHHTFQVQTYRYFSAYKQVLGHNAH